MREPIPPDCRLAVKMRSLATGNAYTTIGASYRMNPYTVCKIVSETSKVMEPLVRGSFIKTPQTEEEWYEIADGFAHRWNFPNCLGATDGKHINMFCPPNGGSTYFNYKGHHIIVLLMAVVDSNYKIIMVDIGDCGRHIDGSAYNNGIIGLAIDNNTLNIPPDRAMPFDVIKKVLTFFVADDAFTLKWHLVKRYATELQESKKIIIYRLSRARSLVESAFGIMTSKFRLYHRLINGTPDNVIDITRATVALHNYLIDITNFSEYNNVVK